MAIHKTAGARFYIGPVLIPDDYEGITVDAGLALFEAIIDDDWTELHEIESFGDLGDNAEIATFAAVDDRRTVKLKTTRDAGTMTIVCARDPLDEGQIAMEAAEREDFNYAFRLVYADKRAAEYSPSTSYFGGMVLSRQVNLGGVQDITKVTFNLGVNTAVFEDHTDPTGS